MKKVGQKIDQQKASIVGNAVNKDIRDSEVSWVSDRWITGMLFAYAKTANREVWEYDLFPGQEITQCQYTTYDKDGHYNWHQDIGDTKSFVEDIMSQRKISIVVQLSNYDDYEGGDFEIATAMGQSVEIPNSFKNKGSIIVFPSFLMHRVSPVTSGTRNSLVNWYLGPPFK